MSSLLCAPPSPRFRAAQTALALRPTRLRLWRCIAGYPIITVATPAHCLGDAAHRDYLRLPATTWRLRPWGAGTPTGPHRAAPRRPHTRSSLSPQHLRRAAPDAPPSLLAWPLPLPDSQAAPNRPGHADFVPDRGLPRRHLQTLPGPRVHTVSVLPLPLARFVYLVTLHPPKLAAQPLAAVSATTLAPPPPRRWRSIESLADLPRTARSTAPSYGHSRPTQWSLAVPPPLSPGHHRRNPDAFPGVPPFPPPPCKLRPAEPSAVRTRRFPTRSAGLALPRRPPRSVASPRTASPDPSTDDEAERVRHQL
jgi:hypothetical protein